MYFTFVASVFSSSSLLVAHTPMPQYFSTPAVLSGANQPSLSRPPAGDQKLANAEGKVDSSSAGLCCT